MNINIQKVISMDGQNWLVQVPINDLMALMNMKQEFDRISAENTQLRREMEGLRRVQSETMELVGDLRRLYKQLA